MKIIAPFSIIVLKTLKEDGIRVFFEAMQEASHTDLPDFQPGAGGGADAPIETQYPRNAVRKGDAATLALCNTVIPGSGRWPQ